MCLFNRIFFLDGPTAFFFSALLRIQKKPMLSLRKKHTPSLASILQTQYFSWVSRAPICPPTRQGTCQSCFAIAAVQCLEDRYAITYNLKKRLNLSILYSLQCYEDHRQLNCVSGGYALELCRQLETLGTVSQMCWPDHKLKELKKCPEHVWGSEGAIGCCAKGCTLSPGKSLYVKYYAKMGSTRRLVEYDANKHIDGPKTVNKLALDLRSHGPVVSCFQVTKKLARMLKQSSAPRDKSLLASSSSVTPPPLDSPAAIVYEPPLAGTDDDQWISAHSASITGWAFDKKGRRFWQVRNSGTRGDGGYLYILCSTDYPPGTRPIGLDVPIRIERSAAHGWVLWGGATALDPGKLNALVRYRIYKDALMWSAICGFAALAIYATILRRTKNI